MLELLNSDWLLRMCMQGARDPRARLTAPFDILDDWLDAPRLRAALAEDAPDSAREDDGRLLDYLARNAGAAGLHEPQAVAEQLQLLLMGALHAELRAPGLGAMRQARQAAVLLLQAATPVQKPLRQAAAWGAALAVLLMLPLLQHAEAPRPPAQTVAAAHTLAVRDVSPLQLAALDQVRERQRRGTCQYPQALMLPAEHRALFLEGVVGGAVKASTVEQVETLLQLSQKVECLYTPAAMVSS